MRTAFITRNIIQLVFETLKQHYPVKPLNEILDLSNGKSMTKASMSTDGSIPVYGANGVIGLTNKALTLEQTITIGRVGSCGEVNLTSGQAWISDNAMWVSRIVEGIDRDYLYFALKSLPLAVSAKIAAMPSISQTNVFRESIPCPSIREQLQVAAFLKDFCQGKNVDNCAALPPFLLKLRRIVAQVEELAGKIEEARSLRQQALEETKALVTSLHLSLAGSRIVRLEEILILDERQEKVVVGKKYPQVGVKGFGGGLFGKEAVDATQTTYKAFNCLYEGAVVLSQVKGWEGAISVCLSELAGRYVSPEYRTFSCIPGQAIPEYLAALVATPWFWTQLKHLTRGMGGRRERTRPEQFLQMEIPMPTIDQQKKAIPIFQKVDAMKPLREGALKELDAMLPSILDKAFKGEV